MPYAIGIDLGTTNSVVSIYRRGVVETLPVEGRSTMPSVVSFRRDTTALVGQAAKSRLLLDPENSVASTKRFMGDRSKIYTIMGQSFSPVDIGSMVLQKIVAAARESLGEEIKDAVITVPAYFTEAQREDTKEAGEKAGLNVLRLVPEPTAAAIAYGLDKGKDQTILVYDLGGGTFDVSILQVRNNSFEVKAVGGDSRLGGDDFDETIMNWASQKFQEQTGIDLLGNNSKAAKVARQRLKEAAETAKIELSQANSSFITIPDCLGHPLELEISLSEYNELIAPLLQKTVDCMHSVMRDAKLGPDDIDRVILVGGSTKNQVVRETVAREIKEPYTAERVDEVVGHGAAIVAANLFLPDAIEIKVSDVTAHSLGVDMLDETETLYFQRIINRQTTYPCQSGVLGFTNRPKQEEVKLRVFRGENHDPELNTYLGELLLPVLPPQSEIVPVAAIFELDSDGIIHFTAVQLPVGKSSESIIYYALEQEGALDLVAVDTLIKSGEAKTKMVKIKSGL
ncbi:MAG: Hsp70 family protein [Okeania sp. SIO3B3]|nr:Hsp70 family protein [Okeania sp. SIO3B3]